jgi:hypothetical protein
MMLAAQGVHDGASRTISQSPRHLPKNFAAEGISLGRTEGQSPRSERITTGGKGAAPDASATSWSPCSAAKSERLIPSLNRLESIDKIGQLQPVFAT